MKGQTSPSPKVYTKKQRRWLPYMLKFNFAPSMALSFFPHLLLPRLSSFHAFSDSTKVHYMHYPLMPSFIVHHLIPG
jgi:hypothetical protein